MNLEGKKSVTRNGVEYPVMWVWDSGIGIKSLKIVVLEDNALVIAVNAGDEVQFSEGGNCLYVNWNHCEPQKEPTLRPYNDEEMKRLVGEVLCSVDGSKVKVVMSWGASTGLSLGNSYISPFDLLNDWTHKDGSPCGVEV